MHQHRPRRFRLGMIRSALLLTALLLLGAKAEATHFRGGTLTWQQKGGNTIQFTLNTSWRRGFFGSPSVGGTISPGIFYFGDGTTANISAQVNSFDATADIINTTYTVSHTYATGGSYVVNALNSNARLSTISDNNHDMPYNLQTVVNVGAPYNNSPVSSLPAIVNVPINSSIGFSIPGSDPDGDNITYRLSRVGSPSTASNTVASADQSRESGLSIQAPPGFSLNPNGTITMNTTGRSINQLYAVQVMMEDRHPVTNAVKSKTPVDFLVRMVAFSQPPSFTGSTPAANTVFNVLPGNNVSFSISAADVDAGQFVTLNPVAVPVGSTMSPSLPVSGAVNDTVSATFNWTPAPSQVGTYVISFVAADNLGVQTLRNITIKVNCALDATTSVTPSTCAGLDNGSASVTASNFSSASNLVYSWAGPFSYSASTPSISNLAAGTYTVRVDDIGTGCFKMTSATVSNALTITPVISGNTSVCEGGTLSLSGSGGDSYAWEGPANFFSLSATPSLNNVSSANGGTYTLIAMDQATGCMAFTTANVNVLATPVVTITPNGATTFCEGNFVTLDAAGAASYVWNSLETTQSINVGGTGSYTVTGTATNGCTATSAPVAVTVHNQPRVSISASGPTSFCQGQSVVLSASGGTSYVWSNAATGSSITVSNSGSFSVTGTDANGCTANAEPVTVTVNPLPVANITTGGTTSFCQGGSVTLTASAGASYLWSDNSTTQSISVNNTGTYSVTVTDANGCSATSASTAVTSKPNPIVTISGATTFCVQNTIFIGYGPQSLTLNATPTGGTPGYSYSWSPAGGTAASATVSPTSTALYTVTATDAEGCSASASIGVQVKDVRCGNNNNKVMMCHGGNAVCVSQSSVATHLGHGDCFGDCSMASARMAGGTKSIDLETGGISVFPNPAHGRVSLALKESGSPYRAYQISDISGRVIRSQQIDGDVHSDVINLDISELAAGVYIIRAVTDAGASTQRFTVE